jgi:hypothetical protein
VYRHGSELRTIGAMSRGLMVMIYAVSMGLAVASAVRWNTHVPSAVVSIRRKRADDRSATDITQSDRSPSLFATS